jgi:phospholipid/cholesterol/gamma-HCH transport system substrate-binding protein
VPNRKEIKWAQLKVGSLVLAGVAIVVALIFLMSGSSGGLFARKLHLRSYFQNASGLKNGAPVALEGVTIGNVRRIRIVPSRNPTPVEVTMEISKRALQDLHTDSTTAIAQAGVLGDSYVDISSVNAVGPEPADHAELKARDVPSIQQVVNTSQVALQEVSTMMRKVDAVLDTLNSKRGTAGNLINDPKLYQHLTQVASNLEIVTERLANGSGSLGKLMTDQSMYDKLNATVDRLNTISESIAAGHGSVGKLLHDEALYNNLNEAVKNTNTLVENINAGKGAMGKLVADQAFADKLDSTITNLDVLVKGLNEGKGTLGQLMVNRSVYDNLDETMNEAHQLLKAVRENPKKYMVIRMKLF